MTTHSPLLDLPAETQVHISSFLEAADILSIRQTCRALDIASHDAFGEAVFGSRTYTYTEHGLRALVDAVQQPPWRNYTREIAFVVNTVTQAWAPCLVYEDHRPYDESWKELGDEQRVRCWLLSGERTKALQGSGLDTALLATAFEILTAGASICVTNEPRSGYVVFGQREYLASLGPDVATHHLSPGDCNLVVQSILTAMFTARFPVRGLSLCWPEYYPINANAFAVHSDLLGNMHFPLQSLTTLYLLLDNRGRWAFRQYNAYCAVLSRAVNLRALSLGWEGTEGDRKGRFPNGRTHEDIWAPFLGLSLQNLELRDMRMGVASYISILYHYNATLTKLSLCHVMADSCWRPVLRSIAAMTRLEELRLEDLSTARAGPRYTILGPTVTGRFPDDRDAQFVDRYKDWHFKSAQGVKEGLMDLCGNGAVWRGCESCSKGACI